MVFCVYYYMPFSSRKYRFEVSLKALHSLLRVLPKANHVAGRVTAGSTMRTPMTFKPIYYYKRFRLRPHLHRYF